MASPAAPLALERPGPSDIPALVTVSPSAGWPRPAADWQTAFAGVQRVPVKFIFGQLPPSGYAIGPGMSVGPTVRGR